MASILLKDVPPQLHQWLKDEAARNRRSMCQQTLELLEKAAQLPETEASYPELPPETPVVRDAPQMLYEAGIAFDESRDLPGLFRMALNGFSVTLHQDEKPVLELKPCQPAKKRRLGGEWAGKDCWIAPDFDETPEDLIDLFYADNIFPEEKK